MDISGKAFRGSQKKKYIWWIDNMLHLKPKSEREFDKTVYQYLHDIITTSIFYEILYSNILYIFFFYFTTSCSSYYYMRPSLYRVKISGCCMTRVNN